MASAPVRGVMTAPAQVHALGLGAAANEFVLVIGREHAVRSEHRTCRDLELFPLFPAWFMHRFQRALHDVGVESRPEPAIDLLDVRNPGIDDRARTAPAARTPRESVQHDDHGAIASELSHGDGDPLPLDQLCLLAQRADSCPGAMTPRPVADAARASRWS